MNYYRSAAIVVGVVFFVIALILLRDKNALRDPIENDNPPYSLARVQLWWWTVLILGSWIVVYGLTEKLLSFNNDCLALLGISGATTAAARVVDKKAVDTTGVMADSPTSTTKSSGFFTDILSDTYGLSVHRFQALAFNLMYGVAFLVALFTKLDGKFPDILGGEALTLLGVSQGTYVAVKAIDNKAEEKKAEASPAAAVEADEP